MGCIWENCSTGRGQERPPWFSLGVEHVAVEFHLVDLRIVPLYTVRGLFAAAIVEHLQEVFVAEDVILLDEVLNGFVILNPKCNIPGLVVSPTVEGHIQQVGLKAGCGCHCGSGVELNQCSRLGGVGRGQRVPPPEPSHQGRRLGELFATDGAVDKAPHRFALRDYCGELRNELLNISNTVGIVTPTVEGDRNLAILHIGDVFNGGRSELEHCDKKDKGLSEVF